MILVRFEYPKKMAIKIDPRRIRTDLKTQMRVDWNEEAVKEYVELMERGIELPPLIVFFDEANNLYILVDGFHRLVAHLRVKPNDPILVELQLGDVEAARWAAIGTNQKHGIRRTTNDKRNAIEQALLHPKGLNMSDRSIADYVGVDHKTVASVRREKEMAGEIPQSTYRTGQDGRTINTAGINAFRPNIPAGTSRIKFGKKTIPAGATCGQCQLFEDQKCVAEVIENALTWNKAFARKFYAVFAG